MTAAKIDLDAIARRLADRAPGVICESLFTGAREIVPVEHVVRGPASTQDLDHFRACLRGLAPELPLLWARWNGLRLCVEPDAVEPNHLLELYPIAEMEGHAEAMQAWLEDGGGDPDLAGAIVIGAAAMSADCLIVPTNGPSAGRIARFDHETLCIEPFAADVATFVERIAGDPIAMIDALGATTRYRLDRDQMIATRYLADRG